MKLDDEGWLDEPSQKADSLLYWLCGLVILNDPDFQVLMQTHAAFGRGGGGRKALYSLETLPAFYGIFGFSAGLQLFIFLR